MHLRCIEPLLRHERLGTVRGALTFAADAEHVDVVSHEVGDIDFGWLARKGCQTDATAAVDHARCFVDSVRRTRTFDDVIDALAAIEPADDGDGILVLRVDDVICAEFEADLQAIVARSG